MRCGGIAAALAEADDPSSCWSLADGFGGAGKGGGSTINSAASTPRRALAFAFKIAGISRMMTSLAALEREFLAWVFRIARFISHGL